MVVLLYYPWKQPDMAQGIRRPDGKQPRYSGTMQPPPPRDAKATTALGFHFGRGVASRFQPFPAPFAGIETERVYGSIARVRPFHTIR